MGLWASETGAEIGQVESELQAHEADTGNPHAVTAAQAGAIPTTEKGAAGGVASLDGSGKIFASELPPLDHDVGDAADEAGMLALPVTAPAVCIRTDFTPAHVFYLTADPATDIGNWTDTGEFGAGAANPTGTVGPAAINGAANTFMRSDAAPALDQAANYAFTGSVTFATPTAGGNPVTLDYSPIKRVGGTVQLELNGEELIWPSDLGNGKIRLWNGNGLAVANRYYGFGIDNVTLVLQGDENVNFTFNKSSVADARIELFRIANDGTLTAQGNLVMSGKKVVNVGDPTAATDAATKGYVDNLAATTLGITNAHTANTTLSPSDARVHTFDATAGNIAISLPDIQQTTPDGKVFTLKRIDNSANTVTIDPGAATIDGLASLSLDNQYSSITAVFSDENWLIIGRYDPQP